MPAAKYQHANAWSPTSMALLLRGVVALDIAAWPGPGAYSVDGKKLFPLVLFVFVFAAEQLTVLQRKGNSRKTSNPWPAKSCYHHSPTFPSEVLF